MLKKILYKYRIWFWNPLKYARKMGVKLGKDCYILTKHFGSEPYLIEIGDHVQITSDVRFFTHGGNWVLRDKYADLDTFGKIKIGNNVYIGNCALILPGVTIGNNVVIAAGSIVTKSFGDNVVIAGNPARVISSIEEYEQKTIRYNVNTKKLSPKEKQAYLLNLSEDQFMKK